MANITLLANELLDLILGLTTPGGLANISLTCKRLRTRSLPHLYQKIHWTWHGLNVADAQPPIHLLLRSIAENPKLAEYVLDVDLKAVGYRSKQREPLLPNTGPKLTYNDLKRLSRLVDEALLSAPERWQKALAEGSVRASVALLVTQLPCVRRLSLGPDLQQYNGFLAEALDNTLTAPPSARTTRFEQLQYLNLGADIDDNDHRHTLISLNLSQFLPFFFLPKLKMAEMLLPGLKERPNRELTSWARGRAQSFPWPSFPWPRAQLPRSEALTSLRLRRSRADPWMLNHILLATPNLENLEYDYYCHMGSVLDCNELRNALKNVRGTLASFSMPFTPFTNYGEDEREPGSDWVSGALGPLTDFAKLKSLEISPTVLLGYFPDQAAKLADVLPPSLRVLWMRDDLWAFEDWEWWEEESMELFTEFLGDGKWRESTPNLEEFNQRLEEASEGEWDPPAREALSVLVEGQGLRCTIVKRCRDGPYVPPCDRK